MLSTCPLFLSRSRPWQHGPWSLLLACSSSCTFQTPTFSYWNDPVPLAFTASNVPHIPCIHMHSTCLNFWLTTDFSSNCYSFFDVFGLWSHYTKTLPDLVPNGPPRRTMVRPELLRAFFFVTAPTLLFVQPMSYNLCCTHPPATTRLPRHIAVRVCPQFVGPPSQRRLDWLQALSFLQPLRLRGLAAVVSNGPFWLVSAASSSHPSRNTTLVSAATCPFEHQGVPLRPPDA